MKTLNSAVIRCEEIFTAFCFAAMSCITVVAVFFRYCLNNPIIWSEEASRYFMVWGICIGIALATEKGAHLGIDILTAYLPEKTAKTFRVICAVILTAVFLLVFVQSLKMVSTAWTLQSASPTLRFPMWLVYLALPIGFGLSTISGAKLIVREHRGETIDTDESDKEVMI